MAASLAGPPVVPGHETTSDPELSPSTAALGFCSCQIRQEKVGFKNCTCWWIMPAPKSAFSEDLHLLREGPFENNF